MVRTFIFWLIVAPSSLAFILGLVANVCKTLAEKMHDDQETETLQ